MKKYKSVELFAGGGGLSLGLEQAGFEPQFLIEINKYASATLKKNRPNYKIINEDISKIDIEKLSDESGLKKGELDLLSGGCPCQSFSYAGKKRGLEDARGTLFYYYANFLRVFKPKTFIFENVKGMLTHDNGLTFEIIKNTLIEQGYAIYYQVLNAKDYYVPQSRERLIVVGVRNDIKKEYLFPKKRDRLVTVGEALKDCPISDGAKYSERKLKIYELIGQGEWWKHLPADLAKDYMGSAFNAKLGGSTGALRRLSLNKISPTIMTMPTQKLTERCHPLENRPLTIRESARIQTFPDDWVFEGGMSEQYKQIGNAVPVKLAKEIGLSIIKNILKES